MSGIINKVKDALHHDGTSTTHTTGTTTGVTGTHGAHTGVTGTHGAHTGVTGTHSAHTGTTEGVAGPHNSRLANAVDPRVDSDLDGSRNAGAATGTTGYGASTGTGITGTHHAGIPGNTGYGSSTGTGVGIGAGAQPVHNSELLNKLDPRVDTVGTNAGLGSSTHTTGAHTGTTGVTGTHGTTGNTGFSGGLSNSTNAGPHNSNLANKADPRVDSDLDGRGNRTGAPTGGVFGASGSHATPGSGTAQNTAGPHNSDLANKLDPRVDSDMDGSRRV